MKKPTPGQLSLGFFAAFSFCFFASFLTSSLDSFLEIIVWPSFFLTVFFIAAVLANQVKDRGQMPIAIVILVSGFLVLVVPAFLTVIGSISPPAPDSVDASDPFKEITDALEILRFYGAAFLFFFFSVVAGLLVSNKQLSKPGEILTKLSFLAVAISLLFNLALIFGLVSFLDNIETAFGLIFLTLLLVALTGIFRLEARKDPTVKSSISFDKDDSLKKSSQAVIPPPIAQQKSAGPKPVGLPNQAGPTSLPSQSELVSSQPEPDSPQPEPVSGSTPTQPEPASGSTQAQPDLAETNQDNLTEEKSPFAENLTELTNPVFKEIKTDPVQSESQPSENNLESTQTIKPGWYQDPSDQNFIRYWDGDAWTGHRQPKQ